MEYLTVHDLVWINNTVTGEVQPYDYVTLEACMAAQYSYGNSHDIPKQAAGLLEKLLSKSPFESGNLQTALIATLTFLNANTYATTASEEQLAEAVLGVAQGNTKGIEAVQSISAPANAPIANALALRRLITLECNTHAHALKLLTEGEN